MSILDRIANDPVAYAFRILALLALLFIVAAVAYAQDVPVAEFACKDGVCVVSEQDAARLIQLFNWLQNEVLSLRAKTGCT